MQQRSGQTENTFKKKMPLNVSYGLCVLHRLLATLQILQIVIELSKKHGEILVIGLKVNSLQHNYQASILLRLRRCSIAVGHLLPFIRVARRCWWGPPWRNGHGDSPRSLGSCWGHLARWKEPPPQGDLWPPRKGHSHGTRGQHHQGGDPWHNRSHGGYCRGTVWQW